MTYDAEELVEGVDGEPPIRALRDASPNDRYRTEIRLDARRDHALLSLDTLPGPDHPTGGFDRYTEAAARLDHEAALELSTRLIRYLARGNVE